MQEDLLNLTLFQAAPRLTPWTWAVLLVVLLLTLSLLYMDMTAPSLLHVLQEQRRNLFDFFFNGSGISPEAVDASDPDPRDVYVDTVYSVGEVGGALAVRGPEQSTNTGGGGSLVNVLDTGWGVQSFGRWLLSVFDGQSAGNKPDELSWTKLLKDAVAGKIITPQTASDFFVKNDLIVLSPGRLDSPIVVQYLPTNVCTAKLKVTTSIDERKCLELIENALLSKLKRPKTDCDSSWLGYLPFVCSFADIALYEDQRNFKYKGGWYQLA